MVDADRQRSSGLGPFGMPDCTRRRWTVHPRVDYRDGVARRAPALFGTGTRAVADGAWGLTGRREGPGLQSCPPAPGLLMLT